MTSAIIITRHYSIGPAASRLRVHPRTLRIYEAEGFLAPLRRGNMRRYSEADLAIVGAVRYLTTQRGLNLAGVRLVFELVAGGHIRGADIAPALAGLENMIAIVGRQNEPAPRRQREF